MKWKKRKGISFVYGVARAWRRKRRFSALLQSTIGEAVHWVSLPEVVRLAGALAQAIKNSKSGTLSKGAPDIAAIKRASAAKLLDWLGGTRDSESGEMLEVSARMASIDPVDIGAFKLYLAVFWIVNRDTILALKSITSPYLAVHMTCRARMDRAEKSIESFSMISSSSLSHIKLIGNETGFSFDSGQNILQVPSGDYYEDLPAKVFYGFMIVVMGCNPQSIIKLDDDNRLGDKPSLLKLLESAARNSKPVQYGNYTYTLFPSAHNRMWHYGKCSNEAVSKRPMEMPVAGSWAFGGSGYVLNRKALWRLAWASLFYRQWVMGVIYEDIAVAEVADKTSIKKIDCYEIEAAISSINAY